MFPSNNSSLPLEHLDQIFLSVADRCQNVHLNGGSYNEVRDRLLINPAEVRRGRTAMILTFGQSNCANSGDTLYIPKRRVFNFNLFDGRCYFARDPLLGATDRRGNFASRMADLLIDRGIFDTIVLAPVGVGGSRIEDWATGGLLHRRLQVVIERAVHIDLPFTHLLWHQGETNARHEPDGPLYAACFMDIYASVRRYGVNAPIYVAQATLCNGEPVGSIRTAQRSVVNPALGIFAGPDTDTIGTEDRFDGCHMAESGLIKHAKLWADMLTAA